MRRHRLAIGGLALLAAFGLGACGVGQRQSPAASDEEIGHTKVAQSPDEKAATYTTKAGDTLLDVAGRSDIYGDPDLWPLIKDANSTSLVDKSPDTKLKADMVLDIPRDSSSDDLAAARDRAQRYAAAVKSKGSAEIGGGRPAVNAAAGTASGTFQASSQRSIPTSGGAQSRPRSSAQTSSGIRSSAGKMVASMAPAPAPLPVATHSSRRLPMFLLLVLVLAALGAVLYVFSRRDRQDLD